MLLNAFGDDNERRQSVSRFEDDMPSGFILEEDEEDEDDEDMEQDLDDEDIDDGDFDDDF